MKGLLEGHLRFLDLVALAMKDTSAALRPCFPDLIAMLISALCPALSQVIDSNSILIAKCGDAEVLACLERVLHHTLCDHWR